MTTPAIDHPALVLLADTLQATHGPASPQDIAKLLGHALDATGYELARRMNVDAMIDRAEKAILTTHVAEQKAYLAGEIDRDTWRPREYAAAAVHAALELERAGSPASGAVVGP